MYCPDCYATLVVIDDEWFRCETCGCDIPARHFSLTSFLEKRLHLLLEIGVFLVIAYILLAMQVFLVIEPDSYRAVMLFFAAALASYFVPIIGVYVLMEALDGREREPVLAKSVVTIHTGDFERYVFFLGFIPLVLMLTALWFSLFPVYLGIVFFVLEVGGLLYIVLDRRRA